MKKFTSVFLLMALVFSAVAADAQTEPKFWVGGSAAVLMMNGTGTLGSGSDQIGFDISSSYLDAVLYDVGDGEIEGFENAPSDVGLNWGNKMMYGLKPAFGVKFNDQIGASAAYAIYFKKSSDESASGTAEYMATDYEVGVVADSEYSMKALQLLLQYYPSANQPGFYLLGGFEMVSLKFKGTTTYSADDADFEEFLQEEIGDDWENDDSCSGVMFGVGYDFSPQSNMSLYGSATYSLAKYDDQKLLGDENLEMKVGGFAGEIGLKFFLGSE